MLIRKLVSGKIVRREGKSYVISVQSESGLVNGLFVAEGTVTVPLSLPVKVHTASTARLTFRPGGTISWLTPASLQ